MFEHTSTTLKLMTTTEVVVGLSLLCQPPSDDIWNNSLVARNRTNAIQRNTNGTTIIWRNIDSNFAISNSFAVDWGLWIVKIPKKTVLSKWIVKLSTRVPKNPFKTITENCLKCFRDWIDSFWIDNQISDWHLH